jgi:ring-1,2-phenylacetyl-CoA epoxidase subunit PaaE
VSRFYSLSVEEVRADTQDAVVVELAVPAQLRDTFRFVQGQHLTLRAMINGGDVRRSYSICSAVQDERLEVAVKRAPEGVFSNWVHTALRRGHAIDVTPPLGHFNVPFSRENHRAYLAFAAGSGITPVFSIIKTGLLAEPHSSFTLVYGNRDSSSIMLKEQLQDLKDVFLDRLNLVFLMSREQQDIALFNGRITPEKCEALFAHHICSEDADTAFLCGPAPMMSAVSESLQARGMPPSRIKIERFAASIPVTVRPAGAQPAPGRRECEVTVIADGSRRTFRLQKDTRSVLDAALAQGIELPYSCKGAVCSTCRARLIEGEVRMQANFALDDQEVARGFVLCCQSYPLTDRLVVDFDQDH